MWLNYFRPFLASLYCIRKPIPATQREERLEDKKGMYRGVAITAMLGYTVKSVRVLKLNPRAEQGGQD